MSVWNQLINNNQRSGTLKRHGFTPVTVSDLDWEDPIIDSDKHIFKKLPAIFEGRHYKCSIDLKELINPRKSSWRSYSSGNMFTGSKHTLSGGFGSVSRRDCTQF